MRLFSSIFLRLNLTCVLWLAGLTASAWGSNLAQVQIDDGSKVYVAATGVGAGWDRYVEYTHRLAQRVQADCAAETRALPRSEQKGEEVAGWVAIDCHGEVTEILELDGREELVGPIRRALASEIGQHQSFGVWPDMMIRDLGKERQVAMTFYFPAR